MRDGMSTKKQMNIEQSTKKNVLIKSFALSSVVQSVELLSS